MQDQILKLLDEIRADQKDQIKNLAEVGVEIRNLKNQNSQLFDFHNNHADEHSKIINPLLRQLSEGVKDARDKHEKHEKHHDWFRAAISIPIIGLLVDRFFK